MAKLYRVTCTGHCIDVATANVFYVSSEGTASDIVAYFGGTVLTELMGIMPSTCGYDAVSAQEVGHLLLDPDYASDVFTLTGSHNSDGSTSDPQLAVCVNLHTGLSGRKRRGRIFLFGLPDQMVENGRATTGGYNLVQTFIGNVKTKLNGTGSSICTWQVFSRSIFASLTDIILDSYKPVTSLSINRVMSTMRSRKPA